MVDLTGQRFGRLVVLRKSNKKQNGKIYWWCQCDCGGLTCKRGNDLKSGQIKSCGCLHKTHGRSKTRTYQIWNSMLTRCNNPKSISYQNYGGRGIKVCKKWQKFQGFYDDMGDCPEGYSLERVDNNKGYSFENCKWIPKSRQVWNRRASGYNWNHGRKKYSAMIMRNKKSYFLGYFETAEEAKAAYEKAKADFINGILPNKALERAVEKNTQGNAIL